MFAWTPLAAVAALAAQVVLAKATDALAQTAMVVAVAPQAVRTLAQAVLAAKAVLAGTGVQVVPRVTPVRVAQTETQVRAKAVQPVLAAVPQVTTWSKVVPTSHLTIKDKLLEGKHDYWHPGPPNRW